jgi:uncharacterized protein YjdB
VTSIGDEAFCYCKKLNTVTIPESVTSIGESAFSSCNGLTSINIPDGVTSIGIKAFYDCSSLKLITIPEGVTNIGDEAFYRCSSLISITLPESVTSIARGTFSDCSSLKFITIPKSVTSIGESAFFKCNRLAEINIPEGVISIGNSAFHSCSSLKSINIPEGVTCINISVFSDCNSLIDINIPESVTSIREYAFKGCSSLTAITCEAVIPPAIGSTNTFYNVNKSIPVYVPAGSIAAYQSAEYWNDFERFEAIKTSVSNITLNQSSITLTEGASITLTAIVTPEDADDTSVTWSSSNEDVVMVSSKGKVVALAAGTATITATANDGSGVSASCEIIVKAPLLGKCATPTINYIGGEFVLTCSTEGAEIKTIVVTENDNEFVGEKFDFLPTHTFTAYATKENYEDSDVATLTICWIPCSEKHESEETSILTIPSKPVLISARDGVLTLSGLAEGTEVTLYTTDGVMVAHQQSCAGEAKFTVDTNQVYLVHIGDKVVKIGM